MLKSKQKASWLSRFHVRVLSGNSVRRLINVAEKKGARINRFVVKQLKPSELEKVPRWQNLHSMLRSLKVPTFPTFEFFEKNGIAYLRQKDFSKTGRAPMVDAWRADSLIESGQCDKAILGIVRDLAIMHRNGLTVSSPQRLLSPWVFYKKPNGKYDRAIVDLGSIHFAERSKVDVSGNIEYLLPFLKRKGKQFAMRAVQKYLEENSDPEIRQKIETFFS